jgi:hypothetical protein
MPVEHRQEYALISSDRTRRGMLVTPQHHAGDGAVSAAGNASHLKPFDKVEDEAADVTRTIDQQVEEVVKDVHSGPGDGRWQFAPYFSKRIFLREILYNVFIPISLPLIIWNEGLQGLRRREIILGLPGTHPAFTLFVTLYVFWQAAIFWTTMYLLLFRQQVLLSDAVLV